MLVLNNGHLTARVLHPRDDVARLGPRYCSGGYVWQVEDAVAGPLLTGPEGPEPQPRPFNGHGLPEAFRDRTRDGQLLTWQHDRGLAPGAGLLARTAEGSVALVEPCTWSFTLFDERVIFETEHGLGGQRYTLTRIIQLVDRSLISLTRFSVTGREPLSLQWFAHPFFPLLPQGQVAARLPAGTTLPPSPGFRLEDEQLSLRRRFNGVDDGQFDLLSLPAGQALDVSVEHPVVQDVRFTTSFAPVETPIWANGHTFSIEPYQQLHLAPGQTAHWTLRYAFGPARPQGNSGSG